MIENQDFTLTAGDTRNIVDTVNRENGQPSDFTGGTALFIMKQRESSDVIVFQKSNTNGDVLLAGNQITIRLREEDTINLLGDYFYKIKVTDATGNKSTVTTGIIKIKK